MKKSLDRCSFLDLQKAYTLANHSIDGFLAWAEENGLNKCISSDYLSEPERLFIYDAFAKTFPKWIKAEKLATWEDIRNRVEAGGRHYGKI